MKFVLKRRRQIVTKIKVTQNEKDTLSFRAAHDQCDQLLE